MALSPHKNVHKAIFCINLGEAMHLWPQTYMLMTLKCVSHLNDGFWVKITCSCCGCMNSYY